MSAALAAPAVVIAAAPQIRRIIVSLRAAARPVFGRDRRKPADSGRFFFDKIYGELLFNC
jgi:hypothetical protein